MASVEFRAFSVFYKRKKDYLVALNNIDLSVEEGDFVVIIGPSGCGKTTLLKSLFSDRLNSDGTILIDNQPHDALSIRERRISYVSQEFDLYPSMTVFGNIAFPLRMEKAPIEEIERRVKEVAEELGLTNLLSRKPKQLSLGQQQRVAFGRAIVKNPSLLLLDEPFSNLDAPGRIELRKFAKSIYLKHHITTIFVTHDKDDAIALANRIAILEYGNIRYYGDKQDLLMNPENEAFRKYLYGE